MSTVDSFKTKKQLKVGSRSYTYYHLNSLPFAKDIEKLPLSLKVLLENLLRHENNQSVSKDDIGAFKDWTKNKHSDREIAFHPVRVLMQDFTGVPAVVDLAAMRAAMKDLGGDPKKINPLNQVDLVIDHSVTVDAFGTKDAFEKNVQREFESNQERYEFLKWGQKSFENFRVVPPGTGICHQVNLEYLASCVAHMNSSDGVVACPDTVVGTDSHTTMVNGLAVLGWGVGGIEAEAAMLGQPISMLIPDVVGFRLEGKLQEGVTATDLVLLVTQMLRKKGVVGKFVEFFGPGLDGLSLPDRATIANMAPEYGATCGFFPIDNETINYLKFSGRSPETVALAEAYAKEQGLWRDSKIEPIFSDTLSLNISEVKPSMAGPKRPQDRVLLTDVTTEFKKVLPEILGSSNTDLTQKMCDVDGADYKLKNGSVVIAAITSCTNTSNPSVMLAAGLVARKARKLGLKVKPWVKTSLAPGSQTVTDYLNKAGLTEDLDAMGFQLVGYGCTTCIGNSGPLPEPIAKSVEKNNLVVASVLSGNRNFEGRINPHVRANYLASPPLVVAYALSGDLNVDMSKDPVGRGADGKDVFLKDIWPSNKEIKDAINEGLTSEMFSSRYSDVFKGPIQWQKIAIGGGELYSWDEKSTYVKHPPYFEGMKKQPAPPSNIEGARILALLGDSVTTDHISPAGSIKLDSPAGKYLQQHGIQQRDFNSYGARRGNHEIMMRGTFANIRLRNEMNPEKEGGFTKHFQSDEVKAIYDIAMEYQKTKTPLVVFAGKEYGTGSSRDWAAKGTRLLGVRAVIAESFERIHRSNLIGMGVLPLVFQNEETRKSLNLTGKEIVRIAGIASGLKPRSQIDCEITYENGSKKNVKLLCRIDTLDELEYFKNEGILHYVLRKLC
ncbi:MAG: aconitate hydratase AcnA [Bdellovibrionales bacterium CG10_big_fil_rev_8_21_14_0_10_45_34]|nr:MAG: aconitate hydratase AcnA [Bdellovibrionales bacterium CG10_big_fil_rev_8_21_14_0_10_45_34]